MEWWIVQLAVPAAVDFGSGGVAAAVAFAVAAVPACVLLRRAPHRPELHIVAERSGEPIHHAA